MNKTILLLTLLVVAFLARTKTTFADEVQHCHHHPHHLCLLEDGGTLPVEGAIKPRK